MAFSKLLAVLVWMFICTSTVQVAGFPLPPAAGRPNMYQITKVTFISDGPVPFGT
jgi:hypothetical protein